MGPRGGCKCGSSRFELVDRPLFVHACHCLNCQRASGSAFGITTIVLERDVRLDSASLSVEPVSGAPHRLRHVCASCRDLIYRTASHHPATALLRSGALDDPREVEIDAHIFVKRKRSWLALPEDVPQFQEGYDRERTWPRSSLDRLARAQAEGNERDP